MAKTIDRHIRVDPEHWNRIETAAKQRKVTANQLVVELAMEALDRREWPRTKLEIHLLRSCMFAAHAIARDMSAAGRDDEIEEIRAEISTVAPDLPDEPLEPARPSTQSSDSVDAET